MDAMFSEFSVASHLRDALEYAVSLAPAEQLSPDREALYTKPVFNAPGPDPAPQVATLKLSSLSSFAEYLAANRDELDLTRCVVHVESPTSVALLVSCHDDYHRRREVPVRATYTSPVSGLGQYCELESLIIALLSTFSEAGDRAAVINALRCVQADDVEIREDSGAAQVVTIKTGVGSKALAEVPSPCLLAPQATFTDVPQPLRPFVLRLHKTSGGVAAALFPADGSAWELEAKESICVRLGFLGVSIPILW
jgi:hypothetical protein